MRLALKVRQRLAWAGKRLLGINDDHALNPSREPLVFKLTNGLKDEKLLGEIFKATGDHFRNDINAIWHRGNFFLVLNGALLVFYSSSGFDRQDPVLVGIVCFAGAANCYAWSKILDMSIRWINVWRVALVDTEKAMVEFGPFARGENLTGQGIHEEWRPEIFSKALSRVFLLLWGAILLSTLTSIGVAVHTQSKSAAASAAQLISNPKPSEAKADSQASATNRASGP